MSRLVRVVLPGHPHHITQRGNRRQDVFFRLEGYENYLDLLKEWCGKEQVEVWTYCLMSDHIHLIVKPDKTSNLSKTIGEMHRRTTRMINFRKHWRGYLWQGRFSSFPMDESWLLRAVAYVVLDPVKAGMVEAPWDYRWSSVHAHLLGKDKELIVNLELNNGRWINEPTSCQVTNSKVVINSDPETDFWQRSYYGFIEITMRRLCYLIAVITSHSL